MSTKTFPYKGGQYEGEAAGKTPHGTGTIKYPTGDSYTGPWKFGVAHGNNGTFLLEKGKAKYQGDMLNGTMTGKGSYTFANGDFYEGEWLDGKFHGHGMYKSSNGDFYTGEWVANTKQGMGSYQSVETQINYQGDWFNNMRHGKGIENIPNKGKYEGYWVDGVRHGKGVFTDSTIKKKSSGSTSNVMSNLTLLIYQNGKLLEEKNVEKVPFLEAPVELNLISQEEEDEFLKGEEISDEDEELMKTFTTAIINMKERTWTNVQEAFINISDINMELKLWKEKLKVEEDVSEIKKQSDELDKKIESLEALSDSENIEEIQKALKEYDIDVTDLDLDRTNMKLAVKIAELNNQKDEFQPKLEKSKDIEETIRIIEKKLSNTNNSITTTSNMLMNYAATGVFQVDPMHSSHPKLVEIIHTLFTKIRKLQQKQFNLFLEGKESETITLILSKAVSEFIKDVMANEQSFTENHVDCEKIIVKARDLKSMVEKKKRSDEAKQLLK
eukprot:gene4827-8413_t